MKIIVGPLRELAEEKEADVLSVRRSRRQRGASMVELALVLFILLLLVAAIADFGRVFNHYVVITNASREGARYASRFPDQPNSIREAAMRETEGSSVELDEADITIDGGGPEAQRGDSITVTVQYRVPTIIADVAGFGPYLPLRAQTSMVVFALDVDY